MVVKLAALIGWSVHHMIKQPLLAVRGSPCENIQWNTEPEPYKQHTHTQTFNDDEVWYVQLMKLMCAWYQTCWKKCSSMTSASFSSSSSSTAVLNTVLLTATSCKDSDTSKQNKSCPLLATDEQWLMHDEKKCHDGCKIRGMIICRLYFFFFFFYTSGCVTQSDPHGSELVSPLRLGSAKPL